MDLPIPHPRRRASAEEIQRSKDEIKNLDASIYNVEYKIEELQRELKSLQEQKKNRQSFIAPLRHLPTEIINEIVDICIHNGVDISTLCQICGCFRDIVVDMTSIWSHIHIRSNYGFQYYHMEDEWKGIPCLNVNYMELLLVRAQFTPVKLYIEWPINSDVLKPIISRGSDIQSLTIDLKHNVMLKDPGLSSLNLCSLSHLHLINSNSETSQRFMNMALKSSSLNFVLILENLLAPQKGLLEHELLAKITDLRILHTNGEHSFARMVSAFNWLSSISFSDSNNSASRFSEDFKASLPKLATCEMTDHSSILPFMDLSNAHTLRFEGIPGPQILPALASSQLTDVSISDSQLKIQGSTHQRLCSFTVTNFELCTTKVHGNLDLYFFFPNLKRLRLCSVTFMEALGGDKKAITKPVVDGIFQHLQNLEALFLQKIEVGEGLAASLHECWLLQQLDISSCNADSFVISLIGAVNKDPKYLQRLQNLVILDSWPGNSAPRWEDFVKICAIERPYLHIYGNNTPSSKNVGLWDPIHWESNEDSDDLPRNHELSPFDDDYYSVYDDRNSYGYDSDDPRYYDW
ncbi:hypothetical protein CPB86DRAFT_781123 [Serendipita vermifera]|nr:hypothetical protein CPB86DRAFT_781123 [Serendipita vermifera]